MSLVAYDSSSESENEEGEAESKVVISETSELLNSESSFELASSDYPSNDNNGIVKTVFRTLPEPRVRASADVEEVEDVFLQKKELGGEKPRRLKRHIQIDIPSLRQFDSDDDEPMKKEAKQEVSSSGLFALLPPPKQATLTNVSFIPNVLQRRASKPELSKEEKVQFRKESRVVQTATSINELDDSDDDDIEVPDTFDDETWQKVCARQKKQAFAVQPPVKPQTTAQFIDLAPDCQRYNGMDNQAFKELVGKKKVGENIMLIDIHEDEIRPDREEWLKSLTDPNYEPKTNVTETVNNTCRAKNHITSLAQKALANDKELQMRWSESRHNRKQTQAKYGF